MSGELERREVENATAAIQQRFPQPQLFSSGGLRDRQAESEHALAMRAVARGMELEMARTYARLVEEMGHVEAEARLQTELKWALVRNHKESQVMAGEDPVLKAQLSVLDDDYFHRWRARMLHGLE